MVNRRLILFVVFLLVYFGVYGYEGGEATQTDWSGGPGVPGPVTDWGNTFDSAEDINWEIEGEIILALEEIDSPIQHVVKPDFDAARCVFAEDIDGDNDTDILGAAMSTDDITWWENDDGSGTSWVEHVIDGDFDGACSVFATDIDDDDDIDVLAAAYYAYDISWWENEDGSGTYWTEHNVTGDFIAVMSIYAEDIDDDGDMDILGAAWSEDDIVWWENENGSGTSWIKHTIDGNFDGACSVFAADLDGDSDIDVLGACDIADDVVWWENVDGSGLSWTEHVIDEDFDGACSVFAIDVDSDEYVDVVGSANDANAIVWWENVDGSGIYWLEHWVVGSFDGPSSVYADDVEGDGDVDILGTGWYENEISWWENENGSGTSWTKHVIDDDFGYAISVYTADVDGDEDTDVLGASYYDDDIVWWEVTGFVRGELISSIYDTEGSPEWGYIDWTEVTPEDTDIIFLVRSSDSYENMGYWSGLIYESMDISSLIDDGKRYLQYKAMLITNDREATPILKDVTIDWGYTDIGVKSFSATDSPEGIVLKWECRDEVVGFNLYRTVKTSERKVFTPREKVNAEIIGGKSPYVFLDTKVKKGLTYNYWLDLIGENGETGTVGPVDCTRAGALPTDYALYQSRPNPAKGKATIAFDLPEDAEVTLTIYDLSGRKLITLLEGKIPAGEHEIEVSGFTPGLYVYGLEASDFKAVKKMVLQ